MKSVALYVAIVCLIFCIDAIDSALLVLRDGTLFFSNDVAGQDDEAGILEMDQQRLVAGGVPWRGNQSDAPVAEYIGIAVEELKVLRGAQELERQRHQLIYVVVRPVGGIYPAVFSLLHQNCGVREQAHVAYMVSMCVRYCNTSDIAWLQPDFGELICQRLVEVIDDQFR